MRTTFALFGLVALAALPLAAEAAPPTIAADSLGVDCGQDGSGYGTACRLGYFPYYAPATLEVAPGTEIKFANADGYMTYGTQHSLTSGVNFPDGTFDTGIVAGGGIVYFDAPTTPGSYPFFCRVHSAAMHGLLRVG